jgi:hypothetical protein
LIPKKFIDRYGRKIGKKKREKKEFLDEKDGFK